MTDLASQISQSAQSPISASADGTSATARPIRELIEADQYLAAKNAAKNKTHRGLRFNRLSPPGATADG